MLESEKRLLWDRVCFCAAHLGDFCHGIIQHCKISCMIFKKCNVLAMKCNKLADEMQ